MIINRERIKNPYLLAYVDRLNIADGTDIRPIDYMFWIDARHDEYRKAHGLPEHISLSNDEVADFTKYLREVTI